VNKVYTQKLNLKLKFIIVNLPEIVCKYLSTNHTKKLINKKSDNYTQADIYNYLGYTHRKLMKYDDAETYYLKALKLDSDHVGALEYIGELYLETDRIEEAKKSLQKLKSVAGESSEEYIELSKLISNYTQ